MAAQVFLSDPVHQISSFLEPRVFFELQLTSDELKIHQTSKPLNPDSDASAVFEEIAKNLCLIGNRLARPTDLSFITVLVNEASLQLHFNLFYLSARRMVTGACGWLLPDKTPMRSQSISTQVLDRTNPDKENWKVVMTNWGWLVAEQKSMLLQLLQNFEIADKSNPSVLLKLTWKRETLASLFTNENDNSLPFWGFPNLNPEFASDDSWLDEDSSSV